MPRIRFSYIDLADMRRFSRLVFLFLPILTAGLLAHAGGSDRARSAYFQSPPPWESPRISLTPLENFQYQGPESLFTVFQKIGKADTEADTSGETLFPIGATDSVRIGWLFDTSFVFPGHVRATMPFAYDRMFSRDTLYRRAYGNGLFTEEYPCADTYVLAGDLQHPAEMLRRGMKEDEVVGALGIPSMRSRSQICYRWCSQSGHFLRFTASKARYESVRCYFENDSLYAIKLRKSGHCY